MSLDQRPARTAAVQAGACSSAPADSIAFREIRALVHRGTSKSMTLARTRVAGEAIDQSEAYQAEDAGEHRCSPAQSAEIRTSITPRPSLSTCQPMMYEEHVGQLLLAAVSRRRCPVFARPEHRGRSRISFRTTRSRRCFSFVSLSSRNARVQSSTATKQHHCRQDRAAGAPISKPPPARSEAEDRVSASDRKTRRCVQATRRESCGVAMPSATTRVTFGPYQHRLAGAPHSSSAPCAASTKSWVLAPDRLHSRYHSSGRTRNQ